MSNINVLPCTPQEASAIIRRVMRMAAGIRPTVMVHGEPGVGKSAIVAQASLAEYGTIPIDVRLATHEPTDIKGLPDIDRAANTIRWIKPDFLPRTGRGALFLDEITQARRDTMAAIYPIVHDKRIDDLVIPDEWTVICAGNDVADGAIANAMGTALADRMLHLLVQATPESFNAYWESRGMHPAILALMVQMPHLHSNNAKRIEEDLMVSPSSRSWERAHNALREFDETSKDPIEKRLTSIALSGCVGMEASGHLELTIADMAECASPAEILEARGPELRRLLPKTMRGGVALAFSLGHVCDDAESLALGCAAMAMLGGMADNGGLKATDGAVGMSGRELAALGIERLLRKAEELGVTDDVLETRRPGQKALLEYLDDVGERHDETMKRLRAQAA